MFPEVYLSLGGSGGTEPPKDSIFYEYDRYEIDISKNKNKINRCDLCLECLLSLWKTGERHLLDPGTMCGRMPTTTLQM